MIILGVSFLADASASLLVNGKVVAAISEERINREKLWNGIPEFKISRIMEFNIFKNSGIPKVRNSAISEFWNSNHWNLNYWIPNH